MYSANEEKLDKGFILHTKEIACLKTQRSEM